MAVMWDGRLVIVALMEAINSSETSVSVYLTTCSYIPEDSRLQTRRRKNLKSRL
jgi:hypothetical protein